ncbi:MAG: NAD(P)/FAD-dependent oxidoreductase [Deltaproteobacteria bacterium]|nr:NAD(P)/FAD-dependent oxidoreductase [Deltaproteobacteria bacterium]
MAKDERFDVVIIGAGPNGMTTAAYLAKSGLDVCVLEERTESGGACETQEPIPGVRIYPHAMLMYASPAPGFEQLELHKFGFRMEWDPVSPLEMNQGGLACRDGWRPITEKDQLGWGKIAGLLGQPPFSKELMRATFWCPPHPPEVEVTDENTPYMQVYKKYQPDIWTPELRDMTMFDLMDEHLESEHFKTAMAFAAWASGAAGHWEGVAIPAALCVQLLTMPNLGAASLPRGGLHGYFHSILRAAVYHGATLRTSCPVDEILVEDGRAVGVRLRETAACGGKTIRASKAVIAACDVHQAFLDMVGPKHLDPSVIQKLKDISLKNQTLYVSTFHTKKPLRFNEKFAKGAHHTKFIGPDRQPAAGVFPSDSRELYYASVADVDGHKGQPVVPPEEVMWFQTPSQAFDPTDCQGSYPRGHISSAFEMAVTSPDLHKEGEDALLGYKAEMDQYMRDAYSQVYDGLDDDNVIHHWSATGREVEFRNTGLIGGTWCGSRHDEDQLWTNRPIPELARYRSPIEGLYHAHQTSGHPGGLCLMAIPYNLMHILIEDGIADPGDWWYASPYYIPQEGKIPASRR